MRVPVEGAKLLGRNASTHSIRIPVLLFLLLGLVQVVALPPFQAPDENVHWQSAVQRIDRLLGTETCRAELSLPQHFDVLRVAGRPMEKLPKDLRARFGAAAQDSTCPLMDVPYGGTLSYPGASLSLLLFRSFPGVGALEASFYLARLFQGLLVALGFFVFLRAAEKSGSYSASALGLSALALTPLFLQQSFSISSDGVVLAFALSLAAWVCFSRRSWLTGLAILIFGACALTTKPVLAPLTLPVVIWMWRREGNGFWRSPEFGLLLALFALGTYAGLSSSQAFSSVADSGRDPMRQAALFREHPGQVLGKLVAQPWSYFLRRRWLRDPLGWLDTPLTKEIWAGIWMIWFSLGLQARRVLSPPRWFKARSGWALFLAAGTLSAASLVSLYLFLTWTHAGLLRIDGFQGRYLFPYLILAWSFLAAGLWREEGMPFVRSASWFERGLFWLGGAVLAYALVAAFQGRYY